MNLNIFGYKLSIKKNKEYGFFGKCAVVKVNSIAKKNGLFYDENKEIHIQNGYNIEGLKTFEILPYTKSTIRTIKELYKIPLIYEEFNQEFNFEIGTNFGEVVR